MRVKRAKAVLRLDDAKIAFHGVTTFVVSYDSYSPPRPRNHPTKSGVSKMNCPYCDSSKVRRSRVRFSDVLQLLLLRIPVRCRNCKERGYISLAESRGVERSPSKNRRDAAKMRRHGQTSLLRP
jgi:hypothetical protein